MNFWKHTLLILKIQIDYFSEGNEIHQLYFVISKISNVETITRSKYNSIERDKMPLIECKKGYKSTIRDTLKHSHETEKKIWSVGQMHNALMAKNAML